MEKLVCTGCGATLVPTVETSFLTCEYCGTAVPNPWFDASQAAKQPEETRKPDEMCVELLRQMGTDENLHKVSGLLAGSHFGTPLDGSWLADQARKSMNIPDAESVYLVYDASLIGLVTNGFALADDGFYYVGDETGKRSWESFVTGAISCVEGSCLNVGTGLTFAVSNEDDARLARFVVDFHNQAYRRLTGETAPADWKVTRMVSSPVTTTTSSTGSSLLGAAGALLASSLLGGARTTAQHRPVVQRTVVQRAAKPARPAAMRASRVQRQPRPVSPAGMQPPRKPAAGSRQRMAPMGAGMGGGMARPGARPGMSRPGAGRMPGMPDRGGRGPGRR